MAYGGKAMSVILGLIAGVGLIIFYENRYDARIKYRILRWVGVLLMMPAIVSAITIISVVIYKSVL